MLSEAQAENEAWTLLRDLHAAGDFVGRGFPDVPHSHHDDSPAPAGVSSFSCRASGAGYESQLVFQPTILRR